MSDIYIRNIVGPNENPNLENVEVGDYLPFSYANYAETYVVMQELWEKQRDAVEGTEAIKRKSITYLPRPNGMTDEQYRGYLQRAVFFNGTRRTVQAYLGMLFRKNPVWVYDDEKLMTPDDVDFHEDFFGATTLDGNSFTELMRDVMEEIIIVNKCGVLVDYPRLVDEVGNPQEFTREEIETNNIQPTASVYPAESIINWFHVVTESRVLPIFFVLREEVPTLNTIGTIGVQVEYRYRILYLENFNTPNLRRYKQILIEPQPIVTRSDPSARRLLVTEVSYPTINGEPIPFIPFYVLTDKGIDYRTNRPSMINDLVNVNLGHYQNSGSLENELYWVGVKTAIFPGMTGTKSAKITLGGALGVPLESKPYILEASSSSGNSDEMVRKEQRMAVLGAERLSPTGRYVASAETAAISARSESANLGNTANAMSRAFSDIANFMLKWYGSSRRVSIQMNQDFYDRELTGQDLIQWFENVQRGNLSFETAFFNLQRRDIYPPGWSVEKEIERIRDTGSELFGLSDDKFNRVMDDIERLKQVFGEEEGENLRTLIEKAESVINAAAQLGIIKDDILNERGSGTVDPVPFVQDTILDSRDVVESTSDPVEEEARTEEVPSVSAEEENTDADI